MLIHPVEIHLYIHSTINNYGMRFVFLRYGKFGSWVLAWKFLKYSYFLVREAVENVIALNGGQCEQPTGTSLDSACAL